MPIGINTFDEGSRKRAMTLRHVSRCIWLGAVLAGSCAAWSAPAQAASCLDAVLVSRADVVFVGTLTAVSAAGDRATFAVVEVWGVGDLAPVVEVVGVPGLWEMPPAGSAAVRYLVLAEAVGSSLVVMVINEVCAAPRTSLAYRWDPSYAALRPATAHPPTSAPTGAGVPIQLLGAAAIMLVVGVVSTIAFRRPRTAGSEGGGR